LPTFDGIGAVLLFVASCRAPPHHALQRRGNTPGVL